MAEIKVTPLGSHRDPDTAPPRREARAAWRPVRRPGGSPVSDSGGYFPHARPDRTGILPGSPGYRVFQGLRGSPGFTGYGSPAPGTVVAHIGNVYAVIDALPAVDAPAVDAGIVERVLPAESGNVPYQRAPDKATEAWKSWRGIAPHLRASHASAIWQDGSKIGRYAPTVANVQWSDPMTPLQRAERRERLDKQDAELTEARIARQLAIAEARANGTYHESPRPSWEAVCQRTRELWRTGITRPERIAREPARGAHVKVNDEVRAALSLATVNTAVTALDKREDGEDSPATCYAFVANASGGYSVRRVWVWGRPNRGKGHTHLTGVKLHVCHFCDSPVCPAALRGGAQCPKASRFPVLLKTLADKRREHREAREELAKVHTAPAIAALETCHAAYRFALANNLSDAALANCERDAKGAAHALETAERALTAALAPYAGASGAALRAVRDAVRVAVEGAKGEHPNTPAPTPKRPPKVHGKPVHYPSQVTARRGL